MLSKWYIKFLPNNWCSCCWNQWQRMTKRHECQELSWVISNRRKMGWANSERRGRLLSASRLWTLWHQVLQFWWVKDPPWSQSNPIHCQHHGAISVFDVFHLNHLVTIRMILFGLEKEQPQDLFNIFYRSVRYCIFKNRKKTFTPSLKYFITLVKDELRLKYNKNKILRYKTQEAKAVAWLSAQMGWTGTDLNWPRKS